MDHLDHAEHWCEECSSRTAVIVHHLNYHRLFNERPEDLLAGCVECHEKMHPVPKAANDNETQLSLPFQDDDDDAA